MIKLLRTIRDHVQGRIPPGTRRSPKWERVRKDFLSTHSVCTVCGGKEKLEVHHKKPFHLHPELELDPENLITLCESKKHGANCHLLFGHLGNFKNVNLEVIPDVSAWNGKLKTPIPGGTDEST